MSLPLATKEISNHPGKNSVTSPTDREALQADVDRKMRLYGVIQAFRQNRYPDNLQIDETLKYVLNNSPIDERKLSREGQKLIQDVRDIIETARVMVKNKNPDELFQNFLFHTSHNDATIPKADTSVVDANQETVKSDGRTAVEHMRTLMTLILTNSEARKLLSDAGLIGRDLFARGAAKAAEKARPDPERLARVDDPAPADQFVRPDGTTHGPNESPQLMSEEQRRDANQTVEMAQQRAREAKDVVRGEAEGARADVEGASDEDKGDTAKRSLKDRMFGIKDRIPQEHRDRAREQKEKGMDFLRDEFPEERRDQFIYRLKKVVVECQKHQDYQEALTWFLGAIETYFSHGRTLAEHHVGKAGEQTNDPSLQRAGSELRTLLERFANGRSVEPVLNAADALATDAKNDEGLRQWFRELDTYIRKTLLEPGFILSPQCDNEANRLRDTGRQFFDEKYKGHKDNLFDQIQIWFRGFGEDPLNQRFGDDWKRLTKDLLFAEDGSLQFKPHLWNDLRHVIIPQMVNHVGYIPIPRIEYTDNQMDLVIENLTLEGSNILPNIVSVDAHNFLEFSPYDKISDINRHDFTFTFSQVQADMRDVSFYFNKKAGMPKMKDSGLADVFLGGEGLTVKVHLTDAGKDRSSVFKVKDVVVKVDSLKFSVRDTKHDLLYKTLKPLATGLVKKQIQRAIADAVRTGFEFVDEQLVGVRDRYNEARAQDDVSTTKALSSMFERKADDAASKADSVKKKTGEFRIVNKRDSTIIPDTVNDSRWLNKVEERTTAANMGDGWKSKAFDIVPTASGKSIPSTVNTTPAHTL